MEWIKQMELKKALFTIAFLNMTAAFFFVLAFCMGMFCTAFAICLAGDGY